MQYAIETRRHSAGHDLARVALLIITAVALGVGQEYVVALTGEPTLRPVLYMMAVLFLICCVVHIIRRLLFHRMDVQSIGLNAAAGGPVAASVVFLGCCIVIATLIWAAVALLNGS